MPRTRRDQHEADRDQVNVDLDKPQSHRDGQVRQDDDLAFFEESLEALFDHVTPLHGSPNELYTYRIPRNDKANSKERHESLNAALELRVWIPPQSRNELFAHHVWNASLRMAELIALDRVHLANRKVLELGAGTGIPGLTAAVAGRANKVVLTDYDDRDMIINLQRNARRAIDDHHMDADRIVVRGHTWGNDPEPLLALSTELRGYDVILLADCIWNGAAHDALLKSINALLLKSDRSDITTPNEDKPFVMVVSGFHSGRACVRSFLLKAAQGYGLVETGGWREISVDGRERPWGWDLSAAGEEPEHEVELEAERNRWVVTGRLTRCQ
ncbi:hypothetical protein OIO90_001714 [Microbotryomycetes sp. JL221]|nr:hypothetical protein OIO90_001714 [Microbotryomycetes sp. JL221]